jgi:3',5'-cyclic AMP phosphodiesterase CpdA
VAHLNRLSPAPDAVLATGDLVDSGDAGEYARLKELLGRLEKPVYLIPGNHDHRDNLRRSFPDHGYLPRAGFLHYTLENWPVRFIALDTLIDGEMGGEICGERLKWLEQRLDEAPNRPTVIFMHHPPFVTGIGPMDAPGFGNTDKLAALIARHKNIERILCGHVHRPVTTRWAGTVASICPSTSHQIELRPGEQRRLGFVAEPPGYQLHHWREGQGLVSHLCVIGNFKSLAEIEMG